MKLDFITQILNDLMPENVFKEKVHYQNNNLKIMNKEYDLTNYDTVRLIAIGKAAYFQAKTLSEIMKDKLEIGLVITKYGHSENSTFPVLEASHPVLDENSLQAGEKLLTYLSTCEENDLLLVAISGGGSALCEALREDFNLDDMVTITKNLLQKGASIDETNKIRRELSLIKNGGIPARTKCKNIIGMIISDVPDSNLSIIASGPTFFEATDKKFLKVISAKYLKDEIKEKYDKWLDSPQRLQYQEHYQKSSAEKNIDNHILSDAFSMMYKAKNKLDNLGIGHIELIDSPMDCNFSQGLHEHIQKIEELLKSQKKSWALISGGELPIEVNGTGQGGRNTHFIGQMAKKIFQDNVLKLNDEKLQKIKIISVGTDGTDGPTDFAGGWINYDHFLQAENANINLNDYLFNYDTLTYLQKTNTAIKTGPTGTNVMDLRIILF